MRRPRGVSTHKCAPKAWRGVPNMTGDYDLDATILHRTNGDMAKKIQSHLSNPRGVYGSRTAYSGNSGNHGDD